jgi:hypothetical protein
MNGTLTITDFPPHAIGGCAVECVPPPRVIETAPRCAARPSALAYTAYATSNARARVNRSTGAGVTARTA